MKRRLMTAGAMLIALLVSFAGAAVASDVIDEIDGEEETTLTAVEVDAGWDDENGAVVISVGTDDEGGDPCEGVTLSREDGELVVLIDDEPVGEEGLPGGCYVVDGIAEDGKVNHGTMVSAVAKSMSPHDLDVPKGWIMREVAKEKPTKVKAGDADETEENEAEGPDDERGPKDKGPKDNQPRGKAVGRNK